MSVSGGVSTVTTWKDTVRITLISARVNSGLSLSSLALALGKSERSLRRVESGDVEPSGELVDLWLNATGIEVTVSVRPVGGRKVGS